MDTEPRPATFPEAAAIWLSRDALKAAGRVPGEEIHSFARGALVRYCPSVQGQYRLVEVLAARLSPDGGVDLVFVQDGSKAWRSAELASNTKPEAEEYYDFCEAREAKGRGPLTQRHVATVCRNMSVPMPRPAPPPAQGGWGDEWAAGGARLDSATPAGAGWGHPDRYNDAGPPQPHPSYPPAQAPPHDLRTQLASGGKRGRDDGYDTGGYGRMEDEDRRGGRQPRFSEPAPPYDPAPPTAAALASHPTGGCDVSGAPGARAVGVPAVAMGAVLGRQYGTLNGLKAKNGVEIARVENANLLHISGAPAAVDAAVGDVVRICISVASKAASSAPPGPGPPMSAQQYPGPQNVRDDAGASVAHFVHAQGCLGAVIGKGGAVISKIQQESGARLDKQQEDGGVNITGTPAAVATAQRLVEEVVRAALRQVPR